MLSSTALEVAVTITFLFFVLSLVASAFREVIEGVLQSRAIQLERAIRELLKDPDGQQAKAIYDHALVGSLFRGEYDPRRLRTGFWRRWWSTVPEGGEQSSANWAGRGMRFGTNLPAYIPARNFALAVLNICGRTALPAPAVPAPAAPAAPLATPVVAPVAASAPIPTANTALAQLLSGTTTIASTRLRQAVDVALAEAQGDLDKARASLEAWYDSAMDRASGWYRKQTQWFLFWIGLALAVGLNVDTILIARHLYNSDAARAVILAEAEALVQRGNATGATDEAALVRLLDCPPPSAAAATPPAGTSRSTQPRTIADADAFRSCAERRLARLDFPMGWNGRGVLWPWTQAGGGGRWWTQSRFPWTSLPGWLLTAVAVTLGAPFWFDALNKIMVIRSTVKPREKSPEEGSEDRRAGSRRR